MRTRIGPRIEGEHLFAFACEHCPFKASGSMRIVMTLEDGGPRATVERVRANARALAKELALVVACPRCGQRRRHHLAEWVGRTLLAFCGLAVLAFLVVRGVIPGMSEELRLLLGTVILLAVPFVALGEVAKLRRANREVRWLDGDAGRGPGDEPA